MKNRITTLLGIDFPLILGPMRLITFGEEAASVSESGGFGQIATSGLSSDRLRAEIKKAGGLTDRPIGINIPLYRPNAADALEIAIDMGVTAITTSAGNPARFMDRLRDSGIKVLHKVSSLEMALKAEAAGVDGIIATGFEAGGHVGREGITTLCLVPQLTDALNIPVVAAGGIADARGALAAFALGAEGIEMGTRFIATRECPVPGFFKELVLGAKSDSTVLLGKGAMPIRVLKNDASMAIRDPDKAKEDEKLNAAGDKRYVQSGGGMSGSIMPCGQAAGIIKEMKGIADVLPEIMKGVRSLAFQLSTFFKGEEV